MSRFLNASILCASGRLPTQPLVEWTLLGDINRLKSRLPDGFCLERLEPLTTGGIAHEAKNAAEKCDDAEVRNYLAAAARALETISKVRNDVLHARPATTEDGKQRLNRAVIEKGKPASERFWIDDQWLDSQISLINEHIDLVEGNRLPFVD